MIKLADVGKPILDVGGAVFPQLRYKGIQRKKAAVGIMRSGKRT